MHLYVVLCLSTLAFAFGYPGICAPKKEECSWYFDSKTKHLTVKGTGYMFNCTSNIDSPWNYYKNEIETVTVEGFSSIGDYAFSDCKLIREVTLPNTVTSIGKNAFSNCHSLKTISLPNSVTSIGKSAFSDCRCLLNFVVPLNVESIESETFLNCQSLISVSLPTNLVSIGTYAFSNCLSLMTITIPDDVIEIRMGAFFNCVSLREITLPNSLSIIEPETFRWCNSLMRFKIPQGLTSIGDNAFPESVSFQILEIPLINKLNSVASTSKVSVHTVVLTGSGKMNDYTISNYQSAPWNKLTTSIWKIIIEEGITSIGNCSFYDLVSLRALVIASSVTSFGSSSFYRNLNLKNIYYGGSLQPTCVDDYSSLTFNINVPNTYLSTKLCSKNVNNKGLQGTCGDYCSWKIDPSFELLTFTGNGEMNTTGSIFNLEWNNFDHSVKELVIEGLSSIGQYSFYNFVLMKSVSIPNTVKTIGDHAFHGCERLKTIYLPNDITSIGDGTFYNCWSLQAITIPEKMNIIGGGIFRGCSGLKTVIIPNNVTLMGSYAFSGCTSLESVSIKNQLTKFGSGVFQDCKSLKSFKMPEFTENIGSNTFSGCTSLESIEIPSRVRWIYDYAFYGTISLKNIRDGFEHIDEHAFENSGIQKMVFENNDFSYCNHLFIGESAFNGCWNLKSVEIKPRLTNRYTCDENSIVSIIRKYAFANCPLLESFIIRRHIKEIQEYAFSFNGVMPIYFEYTSNVPPSICSSQDPKYNDSTIQPIFSSNVRVINVANSYNSTVFCQCDKLGCLTDYIGKEGYYTLEDVSVPLSKEVDDNDNKDGAIINTFFIIVLVLMIL